MSEQNFKKQEYTQDNIKNQTIIKNILNKQKNFKEQANINDQKKFTKVKRKTTLLPPKPFDKNQNQNEIRKKRHTVYFKDCQSQQNQKKNQQSIQNFNQIEGAQSPQFRQLSYFSKEKRISANGLKKYTHVNEKSNNRDFSETNSQKNIQYFNKTTLTINISQAQNILNTKKLQAKLSNNIQVTQESALNCSSFIPNNFKQQYPEITYDPFKFDEIQPQNSNEQIKQTPQNNIQQNQQQIQYFEQFNIQKQFQIQNQMNQKKDMIQQLQKKQEIIKKQKEQNNEQSKINSSQQQPNSQLTKINQINKNKQRLNQDDKNNVQNYQVNNESKISIEKNKDNCNNNNKQSQQKQQKQQKDLQKQQNTKNKNLKINDNIKQNNQKQLKIQPIQNIENDKSFNHLQQTNNLSMNLQQKQPGNNQEINQVKKQQQQLLKQNKFKQSNNDKQNNQLINQDEAHQYIEALQKKKLQQEQIKQQSKYSSDKQSEQNQKQNQLIKIKNNKQWVLLIQDQNASKQQIVEKNKLLKLKIIKLQSIIQKYQNEKKQKQNEYQNIFDTPLQKQQQQLQNQFRNQNNLIDEKYSHKNINSNNLQLKNKFKLQKADKNKSISQKSSNLQLQSSIFNQVLDQRQKYQSEQNSYRTQCQYLKKKVEQLKRQNKQLKDKYQTNKHENKQQYKQKNQPIQKQKQWVQIQVKPQDLFQFQTQPNKGSRLSQRRPFAGKILKVQKVNFLTDYKKPFSSKQKQDSSFRVKKVNHSMINFSNTQKIQLFQSNSKKKLNKKVFQTKNANNIDQIQTTPVVLQSNFKKQQQSTDQKIATTQGLDISQFQLNVPQLPDPPKYSYSEAQLVNLAQQAFELFGIQIQNKKISLNIKKFKNCVLFVIDTDNSIVWHFQGRFYIGGWKPNEQGGQKCGLGTEIVPNKFIYKGQFKNNKRNGKGIIKMTNQTVYNGQWRAGSKQGYGKQKDSSGLYYGTWKQNKRDGQGKIVLFDKTVSTNHKYSFQGTFVKGLKNGYGTQYFQNGDQYRGQYFNGKFHGKGLYIWANDARYDGQFQQGMRHGKGLWKSPKSQDYYQGEYLYNKKNGYGIYKWSDGSQYKGYFEDDTQNGQGVFKSANGDVKQCLWQNGKAIKQLKKLTLNKIKLNTHKLGPKQEKNQLHKSPEKSDINKLQKSNQKRRKRGKSERQSRSAKQKQSIS